MFEQYTSNGVLGTELCAAPGTPHQCRLTTYAVTALLLARIFVGFKRNRKVLQVGIRMSAEDT